MFDWISLFPDLFALQDSCILKHIKNPDLFQDKIMNIHELTHRLYNSIFVMKAKWESLDMYHAILLNQDVRIVPKQHCNTHHKLSHQQSRLLQNFQFHE